MIRQPQVFQKISQIDGVVGLPGILGCAKRLVQITKFSKYFVENYLNFINLNWLTTSLPVNPSPDVHSVVLSERVREVLI